MFSFEWYCGIVCVLDSAFVLYHLKKDVIDLHHAEIPDQYRGKGIGHLLAQVVDDIFLDRN